MKRLITMLVAVLILCQGAVAQLKELGFQESLTWQKMNAVPAPLEQIGKVEVVKPDGKGNSLWSVGCETIERGFTVYDEYKQFVGKLGVGYARLMSGWAKCEPQPGVYEFEWLDAIVDDMISQGVCPWLCICYANPIYKDGMIDLDSPIFTDEETMQAWLRYVKEIVIRYKGKITMYEIWNEPDGGNGKKYPESYVNLFIRTAELIRELDPQVKIAGMALTGSMKPEYATAVLSAIAEHGKAHLMDYATIHPYAFNPDETIEDIKAFRTLVHKYAPHVAILQGENGTNACLQHAFALRNYEWTEYSHAKWYMRRMTTDFRLGIPSSVFTMVDIKYNHTMNNKGLLKSDLKGRVIWVRPAYHAVGHYASILTPEFSADNSLVASSDVSLDIVGLVKEGKKVGAMVWMNGSIPGDEIVQHRHDVVIEGLSLTDPVWVEPITGRICELASFKNTAKGLVLKGLPVWDSQIFVIERSEVPFDPNVPDYSGLTASSHPRVLFDADDFTRLKNVIKKKESDDLLKLHDHIMALADVAAELPLKLEFKLDASNKRMLSVSRSALARLVPCAYAYRMTAEAKYLRKAEQDLLDVCAFKSWNPKHYLDVAEMSAAVSMAYDWLYYDLKASTKAVVVKALKEFALETSRNKADMWWYQRKGNWNQVCNAGLVCSALAIYEHCPELARDVINDAVASNFPAQEEIYGPDGAYPEGPGYWHYGTLYEVLMLTVMENTLGTDFGLSKTPGFLETGTYKIFAVGSTGMHFNYADNTPNGKYTYPLWYFVAKKNDPSMLVMERKLLESSDYRNCEHRGMIALAIRNAMDMNLSGESKLSKYYSAQGHVPIMMCRSGWEKDDLYLGIKGGKDNYLHGHMDGGSFVYDAYGIRWALDLTRQNYAVVEKEFKKFGGKLSSYAQDSYRWKLFTHNCRQHNTLTVNDKDHNVDGFVAMITTENTPERMSATFDLTPLFDGDLVKAERTAAICDESYLEVTDVLAAPSDRSAKVRWTLVTEGVPEITEDGIILKKNGVAMLLKTSGAEVTYKIWPTDPKEYDSPLKDIDAYFKNTYICGYEVMVPAAAEITAVTTLEEIKK